MTPVLPDVRSAYKAGLTLLPVAEDGTKRPALPGWKLYQQQRPTPDDMRQWNFGDRAGFGMVAGPVSGYHESWDFDDAPTFEALLEAAAAVGLADVIQRIRDGYEDETPNRGIRWIVGYPPDVTWADTVYARRPGRPGEKPVVTLIESTLFAILAPSNGSVHPSGRPYTRRRGGFATIASYTREERVALIALARSFDQMPRREASAPAPGVRGDRPGDDYNRCADWRDILIPHGWTAVGTRGPLDYWRRPEKTFGISASTNRETGLLWMFTSSTSFAPDVSYTKFGAYALLDHGGDYAAAAKVLALRGYGQSAQADAPGASASSASSIRPEIERPGWPRPLSDAAYYGLFGAIVRAIESETESDPVSMLLQLLVLFGNLIGRTAHFVVETCPHYLNEFLLLAGTSAKARKGTSYRYGEQLLRSLDPTWAHASGLSSGEGLIWTIRDPIRKHVKGEETTDDPGVPNKRLLVFESELASVLRMMERPGNILADVMKNGWDGRDLVVLTKNSPARATAPHISLITHITIDQLRRYLTRSEMSDGWGNRFLLACVRRARSLPLGGQHVDLSGFRHELDGVVNFARAVETMGLDPEAEARWCDVYDDLSADRPGLLGSMTARAEAHTRRLACLFALSDLSNTVFVPHLEAALAVWRYCFESVAHIFGDRLGDPVADTILGALRTAADGLTRTAIHDLFQRHQTTDAINRALELLVSARLATKTLQATEGRPVERWFAWCADAKEAKEAK